MASAEFFERQATFDFAVQSAVNVLRHPKVDFSAHPYAATYADDLENATFGVVDVPNALIHSTGDLITDSVVIVPVSQADVGAFKTGVKITAADELLHEEGDSPLFELAHIGDIQAECRLEDELLIPIIFLTPKLRLRTPQQLGATIAHEFDHGYWSHHASEVWPHGSTETPEYDVAMEVSAYRLEDEILKANAPEDYAKAREIILRRFGSFDFTSQEIIFEHVKDPLTKNLLAAAFINLMLDFYEAKPTEMPSPELCEAMVAQNLVYADKYETLDQIPRLAIAAKSL